MKKLIKQNFKTTISSIAVFISRLGYLPANVSPLGSFGFFGGSSWMFFATIVLFDWLAGGFYPGFWVTYIAFAMYPLLGRLAKNTRLKLVLLPLASFSFFAISNLGVWWFWYPHTMSGLISCYLLAIPFYKRTLIGDLVFGYGYLLVKNFSELKTLSPNFRQSLKPSQA